MPPPVEAPPPPHSAPSETPPGSSQALTLQGRRRETPEAEAIIRGWRGRRRHHHHHVAPFASPAASSRLLQPAGVGGRSLQGADREAVVVLRDRIAAAAATATVLFVLLPFAFAVLGLLPFAVLGVLALLGLLFRPVVIVFVLFLLCFSLERKRAADPAAAAATG